MLRIAVPKHFELEPDNHLAERNGNPANSSSLARKTRQEGTRDGINSSPSRDWNNGQTERRRSQAYEKACNEVSFTCWQSRNDRGHRVKGSEKETEEIGSRQSLKIRVSIRS